MAAIFVWLIIGLIDKNLTCIHHRYSNWVTVVWVFELMCSWESRILTEIKNNVVTSGEWERIGETRLNKLCYFNCLFLGVWEVHCCSLPSRRFVRRSSEDVKHWSVSTSNGACYLGYEIVRLTGAPNVNFRKISVRNMIWDLEFSKHFL